MLCCVVFCGKEIVERGRERERETPNSEETERKLRTVGAVFSLLFHFNSSNWLHVSPNLMLTVGLADIDHGQKQFLFFFFYIKNDCFT